MNNADRGPLAAVLAVPAALLALLWLRSRTFFWMDITYINHPWRELAAEFAQRGVPPLWNPYAYLGMPLAAQMQSAVWYPGSLPFGLFSFVTGLCLFYALHFALGGLFCYLWLRRCRLSSWASAAGAAAFIGNGIWVSHILFPNELSSLAYLPALLLFRKNAWLLGISLTLCFLSGYPTMLAGGVLAALLLILAVCPDPLSSWRTWLAGSALSMALSALLLLPAAALALHSQRSLGLDTGQIFRFIFSFRDLAQFFTPLLLRAGEFSPPDFWWKTCYIGIAAWAAIALALPRLKRGRAAALAACLTAVLILVLGDSNPASLWLWTRLAPLHYMRYPGNLAYMTLPVFALLVAAGLHRRRAAGLLASALILELGFYGLRAQPSITRDYFQDAGPLVRELQNTLDDHRYLLSPLALFWNTGTGKDFFSSMFDFKHRLYGISNLPYHLHSAGNFGEPLVPENCYRFMDVLYASTMEQAAAYLPWCDVKILLTKAKRPPGPLAYKARNLWHEYQVPGKFGRALWFNEQDGSAIPAEIGPKSEPGLAQGRSPLRGPETPMADVSGLPPISRAMALPFQSRSPGQWAIRARTEAGWLYISEPRIEGWRLWLDGRSVESEPALGAFQKMRVPEGSWKLYGLYSPLPWRLGLMLTLSSLLGAAAYWYNRLSS